MCHPSSRADIMYISAMQSKHTGLCSHERWIWTYLYIYFFTHMNICYGLQQTTYNNLNTQHFTPDGTSFRLCIDYRNSLQENKGHMSHFFLLLFILLLLFICCKCLAGLPFVQHQTNRWQSWRADTPNRWHEGASRCRHI